MVHIVPCEKQDRRGTCESHCHPTHTLDLMQEKSIVLYGNRDLQILTISHLLSKQSQCAPD